MTTMEKVQKMDKCRCQNRRISGRGSRTMRLRLMVTGGGGHDVYPGSGPLYGGNTVGVNTGGAREGGPVLGD